MMYPELHHLGYATRSIDKSLQVFQNLGYRTEGPLITDKKLGIKVLFMINDQGNNHRIELVEDLEDGNTHPIPTILNQRPGSYHLAFLINSISGYSTKHGMRAITECAPAKAFEGRHVQFFMSRDEGIIELIANSAECQCINVE